MRGRDYGNTIYEVTTHVVVMLFYKYCQNVKKSDISCIVMEYIGEVERVCLGIYE